MDELTLKRLLHDLQWTNLSKTRLIEKYHISHQTLNKIMEERKENIASAFLGYKLLISKIQNLDEKLGNRELISEKMDKIRDLVKEKVWDANLDENTNLRRVSAIIDKWIHPEKAIERIINDKLKFSIAVDSLKPKKGYDKRQKHQLDSVRKLAKLQMKEKSGMPTSAIIMPLTRNIFGSEQSALRESMKIPIYTTKTIQRKTRPRGVYSYLGEMRKKLNILRKKYYESKDDVKQMVNKIDMMALSNQMDILKSRMKHFNRLDKFGHWIHETKKTVQSNLNRWGK